MRQDSVGQIHESNHKESFTAHLRGRFEKKQKYVSEQPLLLITFGLRLFWLPVGH